jgi:hypothetical protein
MSTSRYFVCVKCNKRELAESLFDALRAIADGIGSDCPQCSSPRKLELGFTFGLDAGSFKYHVANCYLPDKITTWPDKDACKVEFFPFLVILKKSKPEETVIWLPYWHLHYRINGVRAKYGQWAPCMNITTYKQLQTKAQIDGHL